ncbi:MAG: DUF427 domain-containing protein [Acidimicrobiia bacterium]|nr:DUF427 domain-containing protein [Acidimicrobiia bacterium]
MARHPQRIEPGPGQESVWDYPRPPALERTDARLEVGFAGVTVADTTQGWRVLETSQPPAYYFPPADVRLDLLVRNLQRSFCEWKGTASYRDIHVGDAMAAEAAWFYERPTERFAAIAGHFAFYAQVVDECRVDGEVVDANEGRFYGGWITSNVVGPFKGGVGTAGW